MPCKSVFAEDPSALLEYSKNMVTYIKILITKSSFAFYGEGSANFCVRLNIIRARDDIGHLKSHNAVSAILFCSEFCRASNVRNKRVCSHRLPCYQVYNNWNGLSYVTFWIYGQRLLSSELGMMVKTLFTGLQELIETKGKLFGGKACL